MFTLAPLFGSDAVLARNKEIRVFGAADEGVALRGTLKDAFGITMAEAVCTAEGGRFLLRFAPQAAQTGCTLTVTDGKETVTSSDIAIGEVYFAGGQSNMELELQNADEGPELIEKHLDHDLRYFNVPKKPVWDESAAEAEAASHWESIRPGYGKDMSAVAYFFAVKLRQKLGVPVGVIDCYWGGTSVTCWMDETALKRTAEGQRYLAEYQEKAGSKSMAQYLEEEKAFQTTLDKWNAAVEALRKEKPGVEWPEINATLGSCPWNPPLGPGSAYRPAGLCETMLKCVVPATLTGILFYQGEEDSGRSTCYDELLVSAVKRWRELFMDEELPFLNVQLPMWIASDGVEDGGWGRFRHTQERAWKQLRNSGMAVIIDCGEYDNIHPTDKRTPGERLFEQALTVVYGEKGEESPRATGKYAKGGTLTVTLTAPVTARGEEELMEIAGQDGKYVKAAVAVEGDKLRLTAPEVAHPVAARYAHVNWGKVQLFGENGLPLAPFILE